MSTIELSSDKGLTSGCYANDNVYNNERMTHSYYSLDNHITELHLHQRGQFIYIKSGCVSISVGGLLHVVYAGNCVWIPSNLEHKTISYGWTEVHSLYFDQSIIKNISSKSCVINASSFLIELIYRYDSLTLADSNEDVIESIVSLLIMEISECSIIQIGLPIPKDKRLQVLCNKIFDNPLSKDSILELVSDIPLSYRQATRLFKNETGLHFGVWRNLLKLNVSVMLLLSGKSITWVSYELGYSNLSGFSIAFKKKFGVSPKKYIGRNASILCKKLAP